MPMQPRPRAETVGPLRPRVRVCMAGMLSEVDVERQMLRSVDVVAAEGFAGSQTASPRERSPQGPQARRRRSNVGLHTSGRGRTDVRRRGAAGGRRTAVFPRQDGAGPTFDVAVGPPAADLIPR